MRLSGFLGAVKLNRRSAIIILGEQTKAKKKRLFAARIGQHPEKAPRKFHMDFDLVHNLNPACARAYVAKLREAYVI